MNMKIIFMLSTLLVVAVACQTRVKPAPLACATPGDTSALADVTIDAEMISLSTPHGEIEARTFGGDVPGPVMRMQLGESRRVKLVNHTDRPMSLHFMGVSYAPEDDGTPDTPSSVVNPGCAHVYPITARSAGVWPIVDHVEPRDSLAHGAYGAIVVPAPDEVPADRDFVVFMGQLGLEEESGEEAEEEPFEMTLNGRAAPASRTIELRGGAYVASEGVPRARVGELVRWRIIDASPDATHTFGVHDHEFCELGGLPDARGRCASGGMANIVDVTPLHGRTIEWREAAAGHWMVHCHILEHVEEGMMGWYDVAP